MIGARFYTQLDAAQMRNDVIEEDLAKVNYHLTCGTLQLWSSVATAIFITYSVQLLYLYTPFQEECFHPQKLKWHSQIKQQLNESIECI